MFCAYTAVVDTSVVKVTNNDVFLRTATIRMELITIKKETEEKNVRATGSQGKLLFIEYNH